MARAAVGRVRPPRRPARLVTAATLAALAVAPAGYVALDAVDLVPGVLTSDLGDEDARAASTGSHPSSAAQAEPVASAPPPLFAAGVAGVAQTAPTPAVPDSTGATGDPGPETADAGDTGDTGDMVGTTSTRAGLAQALAPALVDPALGPSVAVHVAAADGTVLYARDDTRPKTPASATKVLTAAALAQAQDLSQRFVTRAVLDTTTSPPTVALVAGGDNLLAPDRGDPGAVVGQAGLGDLARAVARALPKTGHTGPVRVVLDDRFGRGPAIAPGRGREDVALGFTGPVAMLGLGADRAEPYRPATADPALHATDAFAQALTRAGVTVSGRAVRGVPGQGSRELGQVRSAPVGDVLALALDDSDNDLTETVARWACARAGAPTTFAGCAGWVRERLADAGLDVSAVRLADTSGLSAGTRAPAAVVAAAVALGADGRSPGLAAVLARLPVAGLSGTLDDRFRHPSAATGVGVVRAKTGTLTGVGALAGTVVDADGEALTFTVLADRIPPTGTVAARVALDRLAATLAACGCH